MNRVLVLRVLCTLVVMVVATWCAIGMWNYYERAPWTRDARIQADIVGVTPDVSGLITDVAVHENQYVTTGTPLFVIDQERYRLALANAKAAVESAQSRLDQARRENRRNDVLGNLVPGETREQGQSRVDEDAAALDRAQAELGVARLNMERTIVRASVDGWITNFSMQPGDYAVAGHGVFAILASKTLRIVGYFEETKLPHIHIGDHIMARVMGEHQMIEGHVQSIASGIEDREKVTSPSLLSNVNPTFTWVRLPQRIPVRIAIDHAPPDIALIAGRTVTVSVRKKGEDVPHDSHPQDDAADTHAGKPAT